MRGLNAERLGDEVDTVGNVTTLSTFRHGVSRRRAFDLF